MAFNNKRQNIQTLSAKNMQAFQSSLDDAETALAGDPLQEAISKQKNKQQYK